jgi:cellulose synthase/poly-beta-1,6-N-acetylglucosamine synthase-like glycosyltransferase
MASTVSRPASPPPSARVGLLGGVLALPEAALAGTAAYLVMLTVAAHRARRTATADARSNTDQLRFVILIPAHNEERLIRRTLDAVATLDYPPDRFAVHVVADNCSDGTVAIVRSSSVAEVHERTAPDDGGKGPALQWLLGRLWARGDDHDAVVIIDADTTVSPNFLTAMDARIRAGAPVVQGYYAVREPEATDVTALRAAALAARHYLRPLGRTALGGSSGLHGNGMAFATPVLRDREWTRHLTEDIELQLDLLLDGTKVAFAPEAVVEAEMPTTFEASRSQHERWERGRLQLTRRYVPALLRRSVRGGPAGRFAYLDAAIDQLVPPFSVLAALTVGAGGLALVAAARRPHRRAHLVVVAGVAAAEALYVLSALRMVDAPPAVYRSLASAPRAAAWKIGLWLRVLLGQRRVEWVRTTRNDEQAAVA